VYTALVIFLVLHRMLQVSSHWIIRPSRMALYAAIALDFFFHIDVLNYLLLSYLLALPLLAVTLRTDYQPRRLLSSTVSPAELHQ
jgi:hypothetical protein